MSSGCVLVGALIYNHAIATMYSHTISTDIQYHGSIIERQSDDVKRLCVSGGPHKQSRYCDNVLTSSNALCMNAT